MIHQLNSGVHPAAIDLVVSTAALGDIIVVQSDGDRLVVEEAIKTLRRPDLTLRVEPDSSNTQN